MNNTELTLDQLSEVSGGIYLQGFERFLGPISGEGAFKPSGIGSAALGPLGGDGVFKPSANQKGSVIVDNNHFRRIKNF